ncbi:MAG: FtsW/RodA/SpoVE family cell cycle protein [bacterium]|nr:FtsW/RodA/SpoVE family cell cycle protein [bacterium]
MMFTFFSKQDWFLNCALLFLAGCSLTILSSIDRALFLPQLIWFLIAFGLMQAIAFVDWQPFFNYRWIVFGVYLSAVLLLAATFFFAPTIREARSWLVFGPVQFQTSEFAKLALIILFSYFFARSHVGIARVGVLAKSFIYFAIPAAFVLKQPDLGSTIIIFSIWAGFLLVSGIQWKHLIIGLVLLSVLGVFGWTSFLRTYQKERIIAFLNPSYSPLRINYGVIQSKIAIGSAGFFGKGYGQGTQVQLGFLPAAETDFIFAAFVEEWGGLGGVLVLGAFVLMLLRIVKIGLDANNNFSKLICLGAVIMFLAQFAINIGSTLGLAPVIGVTFPFFSYGGSSILINAMLLGIIQSIVLRASFLRNSYD